jgi:hypothetical protein
MTSQIDTLAMSGRAARTEDYKYFLLLQVVEGQNGKYVRLLLFPFPVGLNRPSVQSEHPLKNEKHNIYRTYQPQTYPTPKQSIRPRPPPNNDMLPRLRPRPRRNASIEPQLGRRLLDRRVRSRLSERLVRFHGAGPVPGFRGYESGQSGCERGSTAL